MYKKTPTKGFSDRHLITNCFVRCLFLLATALIFVLVDQFSIVHFHASFPLFAGSSVVNFIYYYYILFYLKAGLLSNWSQLSFSAPSTVAMLSTVTDFSTTTEAFCKTYKYNKNSKMESHFFFTFNSLYYVILFNSAS